MMRTMDGVGKLTASANTGLGRIHGLMMVTREIPGNHPEIRSMKIWDGDAVRIGLEDTIAEVPRDQTRHIGTDLHIKNENHQTIDAEKREDRVVIREVKAEIHLVKEDMAEAHPDKDLLEDHQMEMVEVIHQAIAKMEEIQTMKKTEIITDLRGIDAHDQ